MRSEYYADCFTLTQLPKCSRVSKEQCHCFHRERPGIIKTEIPAHAN